MTIGIEKGLVNRSFVGNRQRGDLLECQSLGCLGSRVHARLVRLGKEREWGRTSDLRQMHESSVSLGVGPRCRWCALGGWFRKGSARRRRWRTRVEFVGTRVTSTSGLGRVDGTVTSRGRPIPYRGRSRSSKGRFGRDQNVRDAAGVIHILRKRFENRIF